MTQSSTRGTYRWGFQMAALALAIASSVGSCQHDALDEHQQAASVGVVSLPLETTAASGIAYRLVGEFLLAGASEVPIFTVDHLSETVFNQTLAVGDYTVTLVDGWELMRVTDDGLSPSSDATLLSAQSQSFSIADGKVTKVVFAFRVDGEILFTNGTLELSFAVQEGGATTPPRITCQSILADSPSSPDGVYTLSVDGEVFDAYCLMSAAGGGWTMVANYPIGTTPAAPSGWSGGERVGTSYADPEALFKMSDSLINAIKTTTYRVHGSATRCLNGPCDVDTMTYWSGNCQYSSFSNSLPCATAYLDPDLSNPTPSARAGSEPCSWHFGLVDTLCGIISSTITSHKLAEGGIVVCTGDLSRYDLHACNGRNDERAGIEMWVR